jgi:hypothetical protein
MQKGVLSRAAADSIANRAALAHMVAREEESKARATAVREPYRGPTVKWRSRVIPVQACNHAPNFGAGLEDALGAGGVPGTAAASHGMELAGSRRNSELWKGSQTQGPAGLALSGVTDSELHAAAKSSRAHPERSCTSLTAQPLSVAPAQELSGFAEAATNAGNRDRAKRDGWLQSEAPLRSGVVMRDVAQRLLGSQVGCGLSAGYEKDAMCAAQNGVAQLPLGIVMSGHDAVGGQRSGQDAPALLGQPIRCEASEIELREIPLASMPDIFRPHHLDSAAHVSRDVVWDQRGRVRRRVTWLPGQPALREQAGPAVVPWYGDLSTVKWGSAGQSRDGNDVNSAAGAPQGCCEGMAMGVQQGVKEPQRNSGGEHGDVHEGVLGLMQAGGRVEGASRRHGALHRNSAAVATGEEMPGGSCAGEEGDGKMVSSRKAAGARKPATVSFAAGARGDGKGCSIGASGLSDSRGGDSAEPDSWARGARDVGGGEDDSLGDTGTAGRDHGDGSRCGVGGRNNREGSKNRRSIAEEAKVLHLGFTNRAPRSAPVAKRVCLHGAGHDADGSNNGMHAPGIAPGVNSAALLGAAKSFTSRMMSQPILPADSSKADLRSENDMWHTGDSTAIHFPPTSECAWRGMGDSMHASRVSACKAMSTEAPASCAPCAAGGLLDCGVHAGPMQALGVRIGMVPMHAAQAPRQVPLSTGTAVHMISTDSHQTGQPAVQSEALKTWASSNKALQQLPLQSSQVGATPLSGSRSTWEDAVPASKPAAEGRCNGCSDTHDACLTRDITPPASRSSQLNLT